MFRRLFNSKESKPNDTSASKQGMMSQKEHSYVTEILNKGVEKKRRGDYAGAKKLYYQAIELDPTRRMAFYSLAKLCYLTGERREAIVNYLRAAHLLYHPRFDDRLLPNPPINYIYQVLEALPERYRKEYNAPQKLAPFIANSDTPCHLAHAFIDLAKDNPPDPEMSDYIDYYRNSLAGKGNPLDDEIEEGYYFPIGVLFLLSNLKWHLTDYQQVSEIYLGPKEQNFMMDEDEDSPIVSLSQTIFLECVCNTMIGIVINWGTLSFRCPTCNRVYIVNPLNKANSKIEQYATFWETNGVKIQIFPGEVLPTFKNNYKDAENFFLAKVGNLDKVLVAEVTSIPGEGFEF